MTEEAFWTAVNNVVDQSDSYKVALQKLSGLPKGYSLCFAFHYVDADVANGGISQLYSNPTWPLVLPAVEASREAEATEVERVLREVVLYYHQRGRSRLKRQLSPQFFEGLNLQMKKSLSQLEDDYYALDIERSTVVPILLQKSQLWTG